MGTESKLVRVKEVHLESDPSSGRVVILKEGGKSNRYLNMVVGDAEFVAIAKEKGLIAAKRPLTHELFLKIMEELEAEFVRVEISHLKNNTYYARITYRSKGKEHSVDSRPSDAIAIALNRKIPIMVSEKLMRPPVVHSYVREYKGFVWRVEF